MDGIYQTQLGFIIKQKANRIVKIYKYEWKI